MINRDLLLVDPAWVTGYQSHHKDRMELIQTSGKEVTYWYDPAFSAEDMVKAMLTIEADGAKIQIAGVLTPLGPTRIDAYFGDEGVSYEAIQLAFIEAHERLEPGKPIEVFTNSPGGTVAGVESTGTLIREIAQERPVIFHGGYMVASAAYWLAANGTEIRAEGRTSQFGSIGVLVSGWDITGYLEEVGIVVYNLTNEESSKKAATLATETGRETIIERLGEIYTVFIDTVIAGRGDKTTKDKIESLAGRVVLADNALKIGLIDSIELATESTTGDGDEEINDPANAGNNAQEQGMKLEEMTLQQVISASPAIGNEVAQLVKDAEDAAVAKIHEDNESRLKACTPYLGNSEYPKAISDLAAQVISGKESVATLKATVTVFDANKQELASQNAQTETSEDGPTTASDPNTAEDQKKVQAEVDKINEIL